MQVARDWFAEYELFCNNQLSLARTMVLLLPEAYGEKPADQTSLIRIRRTFDMKSAEQQCQSAWYWGYECPFGTDAAMTADHVFPYSLGGITEGTNLLWLCEVHNRIKGSDVHVFPWERGVPPWVPDVLSRVAPIVRRLQLADQDR